MQPRAEVRQSWGMTARSVAEVVYPTTAADLSQAFELARASGRSIGAHGNGRSYGDAALNDGQLLVDFRSMARVLDWDPDSGRITVQPGLTLRDLWQRVLRDGWWPPVVTGTMYTTVGGMVAANAHGKNNWKYGPIGEHVLAFELVTPDGTVREVTRDNDPELFHAAIGGFGLLGFFASITLQMKKVHSGRVKVMPTSYDSLHELFDAFERYLDQDRDYVVGWIDAFPRGTQLGRGQIHAARYVGPGDDPQGAAMLTPAHQELPPRLFGVFPKSWMWMLMKPWAHRFGMRLVNLGRFLFGRWAHHGHERLEPHAQFNFLLDFVPRWKWVYKPGGLIQFQLFVPREVARRTFQRALELQQQARLESWLVVMKRHRADPFLMSHAVDGYSFAMDFPVTHRNRQALWRLARRLEQLVVEVGGRFYFAKDFTVSPDAVRRAWGDERLGQFLWWKDQLDPEHRIQTSLWRRVFAPMQAEVPRFEPAAALEPDDEAVPEE